MGKAASKPDLVNVLPTDQNQAGSVSAAINPAASVPPELPPEVTADLKPILIRSAKDAINAAASQSANRSGTSAGKSAASLHQHNSNRLNHSMESSRPSASAILRRAKSEPKAHRQPTTRVSVPLSRPTSTAVPASPKKKVPSRPSNATPIVHTSLKLDPKKPAVMAPRRSSQASARTPLSSKQAPVTLHPQYSPELARRHASTHRPVNPNPTTARPEYAPQTVITHANNIETERMAQAVYTAPSHPSAPRPQGLMQDVIRRVAPRPHDSVKNRFSPAPKGYSTNDPENLTINRAHPSGFVHADYAPEPYPAEPAEPAKPATIHYYGSISPEKPKESSLSESVSRSGTPSTSEASPEDIIAAAASAAISSVVEPSSAASTPVDKSSADSSSGSASKKKSSSRSAKSSGPDNNRYALNGQSPFLKSVKVEKRPLSGGPVSGHSEQISRARALTLGKDERARKNVYAEKVKKQKALKKSAHPKDLPVRPTVIVPAGSHRSGAPLVLLLFITIILGAAVGAVAYLCFFQ